MCVLSFANHKLLFYSFFGSHVSMFFRLLLFNCSAVSKHGQIMKITKITQCTHFPAKTVRGRLNMMQKVGE